MIRNKAIFRTAGVDLRPGAISWANSFNFFSYLNPNQISYPMGPFPHILAVGAKEVLESGNEFFGALGRWHSGHHDWLFGYLGYDLKNQLEDLYSLNADHIGAPDSLLYQPLHLIYLRPGEIEIHTPADPEEIYRTILQSKEGTRYKKSSSWELEEGMNSIEYRNRVLDLKDRIVEGDLYEANLCFEFKADRAKIDPIQSYSKLNALSPMPFSSFHRLGDLYILSASPERFLRKDNQRLISQPIKGTIRRGVDPAEDRLLRDQLATSEKERAENMMIVDLVRNDLSRSSIPGTVQVDQLFGIYSFNYLHQMISTVTSQLRQDSNFCEAIKWAFPMGSMTGAPKIKSMQLIEMYEKSKRGIYSGAAGYITPAGDFDFSVLIRTIVYRADLHRLSFQVGSAITFDSDPEKEYQECLLKARPLFEALDKKSPF